MSELRVAIYIHRLIANASGIQRYAVELANGLHEAGHDASLVTGADDGDDADSIAALQVLGGNTRRRHLLWTLARRPRFEHVAGDFDVVHMSSPAITVPTKRPLVATIHDLMPLEQPEWYPPRQRWMFGRALHYAVDHATALITPSEFVRQGVIDRFGVEPARITAVPEGVARSLTLSARPAAAGSAEDRPFVLAIGALIPRKNLDVLIDAIAALPPGPGTPRLLIVGDGQERERLQSRIDTLADPDGVRLLGRVEDDELGPLLSGALGLVHPALVEGFGLTTIEAMSAGVPVIASATGALPEVVGDAGVLLAPDDVAGWAQAITRLVSDREWREALRERGLVTAAGYTWQKAAAATSDIYQRVAR